MGERLPYTQVVAGSNPAPRTERSGRGAHRSVCSRDARVDLTGAPPFRTARRFAPEIETPSRAVGALRRVPILRCRFVKGGVPPFHTFPPVMRAANPRFGAILFFRLLGGDMERRSPTGIARERETRPNNAAPRQSHGQERRSPTGIARERETRPNNAAPRQSHGQERRSPTGIARERETRSDDAAPLQSHGCQPTHRQPRRIAGTWSAGLRPASRGSAKPPPTTLRHPNLTAANPCIANREESRGHGAPVSDRHRAGARNQHRRRCATPISRRSAGLQTGTAARRAADDAQPTAIKRGNGLESPPGELASTAARRAAKARTAALPHGTNGLEPAPGELGRPSGRHRGPRQARQGKPRYQSGVSLRCPS